MAESPNYTKGHWLALCDECGCKFKSYQLKKRWDGLMVCARDWEPRQPQDFVRAKIDIQAIPWSRAEPTDSFVSTPASPYSVDSVPSGTFTTP